MSDAGSIPALEARNISVSYGHVRALSEASISARSGEVVALLGDNGAGKSTLVKCISGVLAPEAGEILLGGVPTRIRNSKEARARGIETVYQDLALAPHLDVAQNFFMGREIAYGGWLGRFRIINRPAMRSEAAAALQALGVRLPSVSVPLQDLSGGQRQSVAIARAARWAKSILILDEPTAALGVRQTERVLETIRNVSAAGAAIILISHNLPHVFEVSHRLVVLRQGSVALEAETAATTPEAVVAAMLGAGRDRRAH
jgi:ABC-type sugar transport system ATPase subunit